ncbi:galactoside O-acetyltransferase [Nitratiruptor sp. YY09-18]|nr:galactoside O-acetyltransferase [Nitratiruptor sp. YY09-18]
MRATIISGKNGIVIGENSIIGAGSLVNKSVEDNVLVAGVPIKKLKRVKKYE